jgi:hypothetical protein
VNQIIPKLFTDPSGEEIVQNKGFIFPVRRAPSSSFLDRTAAAQRPEKHR